VAACAVGAAGLGAVFGLVMVNLPVWRPLAPPKKAAALLMLGVATGVCASGAAGVMAGMHHAGALPATAMAVGVVAVVLLGPAGMVSAAIIATQPPGQIR
jgi:hypothetical protein